MRHWGLVRQQPLDRRWPSGRQHTTTYDIRVSEQIGNIGGWELDQEEKEDTYLCITHRNRCGLGNQSIIMYIEQDINTHNI